MEAHLSNLKEQSLLGSAVGANLSLGRARNICLDFLSNWSLSPWVSKKLIPILPAEYPCWSTVSKIHCLKAWEHPSGVQFPCYTVWKHLQNGFPASHSVLQRLSLGCPSYLPFGFCSLFCILFIQWWYQWLHIPLTTMEPFLSWVFSLVKVVGIRWEALSLVVSHGTRMYS